jgi:hypothetical protein
MMKPQLGIHQRYCAAFINTCRQRFLPVITPFISMARLNRRAVF